MCSNEIQWRWTEAQKSNQQPSDRGREGVNSYKSLSKIIYRDELNRLGIYLCTCHQQVDWNPPAAAHDIWWKFDVIHFNILIKMKNKFCFPYFRWSIECQKPSTNKRLTTKRKCSTKKRVPFCFDWVLHCVEMKLVSLVIHQNESNGLIAGNRLTS